MIASSIGSVPTPQQVPDRPRFLSAEACQDIAQRLARVAEGGGYTVTNIYSTWTGNVRWARNRITTSGEVRNDYVKVLRNLNGAINGWTLINDTSDDALIAVARRAERIARLSPEHPQSDLIQQLANEPVAEPTLFFDATYQLDATKRASAAVTLARYAAEAGMLSSGYIEVTAQAIALIDTFGRTRYCPYTSARFGVTVRSPDGKGSGWAGVDWPDWSKIETENLVQLALSKCLASRNPVRVEPGRYTTILEPQAVCDLTAPMMQWGGLWVGEKTDPHSPLYKKVGKQIIDRRLSISADPADPELGFPPFNPLLGNNVLNGDWFWYSAYHPVTWVRNGVFQQFGWDRGETVDGKFKDTHLEQEGAYRISVTGETTSIDEMIASTTRGLLVTRFDGIVELDAQSLLQQGYTRDGVWLIEHGKISKPVKNLQFTMSPFFALNNVEHVGIPQRTFHPKRNDALSRLPEPVIVPALKVRDFNFSALTDAI
jgi:predicted Zn-dependent protease